MSFKIMYDQISAEMMFRVDEDMWKDLQDSEGRIADICDLIYLYSLYSNKFERLERTLSNLNEDSYIVYMKDLIDYLNTLYIYKEYLNKHPHIILSFMQNNEFTKEEDYWAILQLRNLVSHHFNLLPSFYDLKEKKVFIDFGRLKENLLNQPSSWQFKDNGDALINTKNKSKKTRTGSIFIKYLNEEIIPFSSKIIENREFFCLDSLIEKAHSEIVRMHREMMFHYSDSCIDNILESYISLLKKNPVIIENSLLICCENGIGYIDPVNDLRNLLCLSSLEDFATSALKKNTINCFVEFEAVDLVRRLSEIEIDEE